MCQTPSKFRYEYISVVDSDGEWGLEARGKVGTFSFLLYRSEILLELLYQDKEIFLQRLALLHVTGNIDCIVKGPRARNNGGPVSAAEAD